jgi:hypothetical protein
MPWVALNAFILQCIRITPGGPEAILKGVNYDSRDF